MAFKVTQLRREGVMPAGYSAPPRLCCDRRRSSRSALPLDDHKHKYRIVRELQMSFSGSYQESEQAQATRNVERTSLDGPTSESWWRVLILI